MALEDCKDLYEAIIHCLENITKDRTKWDAKSLADAQGILTQITTSAFIIALEKNLSFAGYLKSLSTMLQGSYSDILSAHQQVELVKSKVEDIRNDLDNEFPKVCESS